MKTVRDKIFEVIEALKANGTIRFYADVYHALDMSRQNFNSVKTKEYNFTTEQVYTFINHYNVNANFIFKNSPKMFDTNSTQRLKKSDLTLFSIN